MMDEVDSSLLTTFNLLISSSRGEERDANSELRYLLQELGDNDARTSYTLVSGLTIAMTSLEPSFVVKHMRSLIHTSPWKFRFVLKVKPVLAVVKCGIDEIRGAVSKQMMAVKEGETFRISVEKRRNRISSKEIIDAVAEKVPRKVDLQNPQKVIMIEIIGDLAGVSIIDPDDVLGVEKEKRNPISRRPTTLSVQ